MTGGFGSAFRCESLGLAADSADRKSCFGVKSTRFRSFERNRPVRQSFVHRVERNSRKRTGFFDSETSLFWVVWLPPEETEASQRPIVQLDTSSGSLDGGGLDHGERPAPARADFGGALSTATRPALKPDGPRRYPILEFGVAPGDRGQFREA